MGNTLILSNKRVSVKKSVQKRVLLSFLILKNLNVQNLKLGEIINLMV